MSDELFIRLRGRVQGPFTADQLQSLAKRGQFGRTHEISTDGVSWSRASNRPELFTKVVPAELVAVDAPLSPEPPPANAVPPTVDAWYYHQLGTSHGPVDFNYLQYLANTGQILPEDKVWKTGLTEWIVAGGVPGLFNVTAAAAPISSASPSSNQSFGSSQMRSCPFCAEQIAASAIKCKHCGSILIPIQQGNNRGFEAASSGLIHPSNSPKDPLLMALLSGCCIAGLGQIALGQTTKGVMILLGSMALGAVTAGASILVTWPLGGLDAYLIAKKLKSGKSVGQWECF
jgi:hypothetical protein